VENLTVVTNDPIFRRYKRVRPLQA
jgi:hypothetical protein